MSPSTLVLQSDLSSAVQRRSIFHILHIFNYIYNVLHFDLCITEKSYSMALKNLGI